MAEAPSSRTVIRRLVAEYGLDRICVGILASFADRPDFARLSPPRGDLSAWVRWNVELIVRWFDGRPPTEPELDRFRELGRICAANGTPPDAIPANYRLGARFAWSQVVQAASEQEHALLIDGADVILGFVDLISNVFAEAYDEAMRSPLISERARAVRGLLERLAAGRELLAEDHALAEGVGFDVNGPFVAFVVGWPGRPAEDHIMVARRLVDRGAVAASRGRRVTGVGNTALGWSELGEGWLAAESRFTDRRLLGDTLAELQALAEVATARGHVGQVDTDDYLPEILLYRSPRIAQRIHNRVYGPLASGGRELARTLDCLVEHGFDRARTSAALPAHRNTLTNRIDRIRALTGLDIDSGDGRAMVWLAWRIRAGPPPDDRDPTLPL